MAVTHGKTQIFAEDGGHQNEDGIPEEEVFHLNG